MPRPKRSIKDLYPLNDTELKFLRDSLSNLIVKYEFEPLVHDSINDFCLKDNITKKDYLPVIKQIYDTDYSMIVRLYKALSRVRKLGKPVRQLGDKDLFQTKLLEKDAIKFRLYLNNNGITGADFLRNAILKELKKTSSNTT